jgi:hypothetical protein
MGGISSGAIGETALTDPLTAWFMEFPLIEPYAKGMSMVLNSSSRGFPQQWMASWQT